MRTKQWCKILAFLLCFVLVFPLLAQPVYAWKVKTHVYSANLILDEIRRNNGYVEIPPFGKFKVKDEYLQAIQSYPDYFRAGSMGPDNFPDIFAGQSTIHVKTKIKSGEWVKHLWNAAMNMPTSSPLAAGLGSAGTQLNQALVAQRNQAIAFVLGFMCHASGDLFGHAYVNTWAGGPFPDIFDGANQAERENVLRHNVVESYIDLKIPSSYKEASKNTIGVPKEFIFKNLITNGQPANYDDISEDKRDINDIYKRAQNYPKLFDIAFSIRNTLKDDIPGRWSLSPIRLYEEFWFEDIDEALDAWIDVSEKVAKYTLLPEGGTSKIKDEITAWAGKHFMSMIGFPDVAIWIVNAIGDVVGFLTSLLPQFLQNLINSIKVAFYDVMLNMAIGIEYSELQSISKEPEIWLEKPELFPANAERNLSRDMGAFSTNTNPLTNNFKPFYNTLIMIKLCLIGPEGVNELLTKAGANELYRANSDPIVSFIESFDVGYNWYHPNFKGLALWDDLIAREKVFNFIFKPIDQNIKWGSIYKHEIEQQYQLTFGRMPTEDEVNFYLTLIEGGWSIEEAKADIRHTLVAQQQYQQWRTDTEIQFQSITQDTSLNTIKPGKGRAVFTSLNLNGKTLTVNCDLYIASYAQLNLSGGTLIVNGDLKVLDNGKIQNVISDSSNNLNSLKGRITVQGKMTTGSQSEVHINGGIIYVNGEIQASGKWKLGGGKLDAQKNVWITGGTFDVDGGLLSAKENLDMADGCLYVNGGRVHVKGEMCIATVRRLAAYTGAPYKYNSIYYRWCSATLKMTNPKDTVIVEGDFAIASMESHEKLLSDGTIEVMGDFIQCGGNYEIHYGVPKVTSISVNAATKKNFKASGNHRVLLSGTKNQKVVMLYPGENESGFNVLELLNNKEVKFETGVLVKNLFCHNSKKFTLSNATNSVFPDYDGDGIKDNLDSSPGPSGTQPSKEPFVIAADSVSASTGSTGNAGSIGNTGVTVFPRFPDSERIVGPLFPDIDIKPGTSGGSTGNNSGIDLGSVIDPGIPSFDPNKLDPGIINRPRPGDMTSPGQTGNNGSTDPVTPGNAGSTTNSLNLRAIAEDNGITLQWEPYKTTSGKVTYYLYRALTPGGQSTIPLTDFAISGTTYTDENIQNGVTYYYILKPAINNAGIGVVSNEVSITTAIVTVEAKQSLELKAVAGVDSVTLQWNAYNADKGKVMYNLYRSTSPGRQGTTPLTDFAISGTTFTDENVQKGTTYYYILKPVVDNKATGVVSNEASATLAAEAVNTVKPLSLKAVAGNGRVNLEWSEYTATTGKVLYCLYRAASSGRQSSTPLTDFAVSGTTYIDENVQNGTTYYYIVKPMVNNTIINLESNEASATPVKGKSSIITLRIGNPNMTVDGVIKEIDPGRGTSPVITSGRTFIPIRAVVEAMDGTVAWDAGERKVTMSCNDKVLEMWVGSKKARLNGKDIECDVAPYISDTGRTMMPFRFVLENLGCQVQWEPNERKITIEF